MKSIMVNVRPEDRISQTQVNDGRVNHANCEFALNKPIHLRKNGGRFYMRSAYFPITYKNIVKGLNDRFLIRFKKNTGSDDDAVFVVIQIPAGQYDTLSALASAINGEVGALNGGLSGTTFNRNKLGGGAVNAYGSDSTEQTRAILTASMTCTVSSDAQSKNHLVFEIPDNCVFASTSIMTRDGGTIGATDLNSFSILFKDSTGSPVATVLNRTAHKQMGFSSDKLYDDTGTFSANDGDDIVNGGTIETARTSAGSTPDKLFLRSANTGSVLFTPYIYVRCDLARSAIETKPRGSKQTDLIAKIPVSSSGYGDANFYEPNNMPMYFDLAEGTIDNFILRITDDEQRELPLEEGDWSMCLVFEGDVQN